LLRVELVKSFPYLLINRFNQLPEINNITINLSNDISWKLISVESKFYIHRWISVFERNEVMYLGEQKIWHKAKKRMGMFENRIRGI